CLVVITLPPTAGTLCPTTFRWLVMRRVMSSRRTRPGSVLLLRKLRRACAAICSCCENFRGRWDADDADGPDFPDFICRLPCSAYVSSGASGKSEFHPLLR